MYVYGGNPVLSGRSQLTHRRLMHGWSGCLREHREPVSTKRRPDVDDACLCDRAVQEWNESRDHSELMDPSRSE